MLSELPNSFIMRQLNILSGTHSTGIIGVISYVANQIDVLIRYILVLALAVVISLEFIFWPALFLFLFIRFLLYLGTPLGCVPHGDDVAQ